MRRASAATRRPPVGLAGPGVAPAAEAPLREVVFAGPHVAARVNPDVVGTEALVEPHKVELGARKRVG